MAVLDKLLLLGIFKEEGVIGEDVKTCLDVTYVGEWVLGGVDRACVAAGGC